MKSIVLAAAVLAFAGAASAQCMGKSSTASTPIVTAPETGA